jgi:hypothetical protein
MHLFAASCAGTERETLGCNPDLTELIKAQKDLLCSKIGRVDDDEASSSTTSSFASSSSSILSLVSDSLYIMVSRSNSLLDDY